nr:hypothetical protein [Tanacetum cinerariifolium]
MLELGRGSPLYIMLQNWEILYEEDKENLCLSSKRVCIKTTIKNNIFESFKIIVHDKLHWVRAKEVTTWEPDFTEDEEVEEVYDEDVAAVDLEKEIGNLKNECNSEGDSDYEEKQHDTNNETKKSDSTLKYPLKFTLEENVEAKSGSMNNLVRDKKPSNEKAYDEKSILEEKNSKTKSSKVKDKESGCSGHFRRVEGPQLEKIRLWIKEKKESSKSKKSKLKGMLSDIDVLIDNKYWGILEKDVVDMVSYFFNYGTIPKGGNSSFIALILKLQDAKLVKDFRPISLIGSLYKIIAKTLANRLVGVLGDIVNEVQSAFVFNRQILDGPFILNDLIHWSLMFKCLWHFRNDGNSLWARFIKAMYGKDGNLDTVAKRSYPSAWMDIVNELHKLKNQDLDLISLMKKKVGNGVDTLFWEEVWRGDNMFKSSYPRVYALEYDKSITVAAKLAQDDLGSSLRRMPRDEAELMQFSKLKMALAGLQLPMIQDRWSWFIVGSADFFVASVRKYIDDHQIVGNYSITRWVTAVPIKINIMAWKVRFDYLPTRLNLSSRGLDLQSILYDI